MLLFGLKKEMLLFGFLKKSVDFWRKNNRNASVWFEKEMLLFGFTKMDYVWFEKKQKENCFRHLILFNLKGTNILFSGFSFLNLKFEGIWVILRESESFETFRSQTLSNCTQRNIFKILLNQTEIRLYFRTQTVNVRLLFHKSIEKL